MAIKKIPCGGWSYDDSEIVFEDGVIHPIAGGGSGAMIVTFTMDEEGNLTADKTVEEVTTAFNQGEVITGILSVYEISMGLGSPILMYMEKPCFINVVESITPLIFPSDEGKWMINMPS